MSYRSVSSVVDDLEPQRNQVTKNTDRAAILSTNTSRKGAKPQRVYLDRIDRFPCFVIGSFTLCLRAFVVQDYEQPFRLWVFRYHVIPLMPGFLCAPPFLCGL